MGLFTGKDQAEEAVNGALANEGDLGRDQAAEERGEGDQAALGDRTEATDEPAGADAKVDRDTATEDRVVDRSRQLFEALVRLDGRLADPGDLAFDEALVDDPAALESAITSLIEKNPRLKAVKFPVNPGAGQLGDSVPEKFDLIDLIRNT